MNAVRRFFAGLAFKALPKTAQLSLLSAQGWPGYQPTWAKVPITEQSQLQIAAAFSAIRLIAETVGTLPLHLYQRTDKGRRRASDHPLYALVHDQPNAYQTAIEWKEAMAVSLCTRGQAYNLVTRLAGEVVSVQSLDKSRVQPKVHNGRVTYIVTMPGGGQDELKRSDVVPVRGFGGVGNLEGFAPHQLHANSLALTLAVEKYGAEFFGSGARPTGVLTTEADFKSTERDALRASFARYMRESWEKGELPVLDSKTQYAPITTPNNEAQFIETRKLQIAEIARIYRVPLHMLMEMDKASYANTEQANKHFLDYTLMPYLVRIEQALNSCLLDPSERKRYYFEFDARGLLRGDSAARARYYLDMRQAGAMTQNEIRVLENMDTHPDADDLHVPLNMAPSDTLRALQNKD